MSGGFVFCEVCGGQVILERRHVTVSRNVEQLVRGAITVHDSVAISHLHLTCGERIVATGETTEGVRS